MSTLGAKSSDKSSCVVAAITALPFCRASFCRLKATIFAVSRSSVLQNSSMSHHCFCASIKRAIW